MPELNRKDVPVQDTWNLSDLFLNDGAWKESGDKIASLAQVFCEKYEGKLKGSDNVPLLLQAVSDFDDIHSLVSPFAAYAQLDYAADHTDAQKAAKAKRMSSLLSELSARLSFFRSELSELDVEVLAEAAKSEEFGAFLEEIIREKKHRLHPETERVLAALSGSIIDLPEEAILPQNWRIWILAALMSMARNFHFLSASLRKNINTSLTMTFVIKLFRPSQMFWAITDILSPPPIMPRYKKK